MQREEALRVRQAWGEKPCDHPDVRWNMTGASKRGIGAARSAGERIVDEPDWSIRGSGASGGCRRCAALVQMFRRCSGGDRADVPEVVLVLEVCSGHIDRSMSEQRPRGLFERRKPARRASLLAERRPAPGSFERRRPSPRPLAHPPQTVIPPCRRQLTISG